MSTDAVLTLDDLYRRAIAVWSRRNAVIARALRRRDRQRRCGELQPFSERDERRLVLTFLEAAPKAEAVQDGR